MNRADDLTPGRYSPLVSIIVLPKKASVNKKSPHACELYKAARSP